MTRINGDENVNVKWRYEEMNRLPLYVIHLTKICTNYNQSIRNEIVAIKEDPALRFNVLMQTRNSSCLICNVINNIHRLSNEANVAKLIFSFYEIFIPENVKSCIHYLDDRGFILQPLLTDLYFVNRSYI